LVDDKQSRGRILSISLAIKNLFSAQTSNEWLMQKYVQTDDAKYLSLLYENCAKDLYFFLLKQTDHAMAADLSQGAWLKVIDKKHLYHSDSRFVTWLFSIGRNLMIDEFRRNQHIQTDLNVELVKDAAKVSDGVFENPDLGRMMDALPFEQKEALCLQLEGFGLAEIAQITHSNVETIKSRLRYGRNQLKKANVS
jgi:RNA polymerase sigma-70 factor (ECF subfamily)